MNDSTQHVDANFKVETAISKDGLSFYDVKSAPFEVYGLYDYKNQTPFKRMPDAIAKSVSEGVAALYTNTSGGRVRFSTDSDRIVLKAEVAHVARMPHFSITGVCSFDLYEDFPALQTSRYIGTFIPPYKVTDGFEAKIVLKERKKRYFTVHFPLYSNVASVLIGINEGASLEEGMKYKQLAPVVYYGNSVTQGGCASRAGNSYPNIIGRRLNLDFINLGFSGSGRAEETMTDYLSGLDMSVFVCDYDYNAPDADYLKATHLKLYQKIRASHPDTPFIMMSRCNFVYSEENSIARRDVIYESFRYARNAGDTNVYFMDGASIYRGDYANIAVIDQVHPSDLGFALIADSLEGIIIHSLENNI